jgi:hypothetical protein
MHVYACLCSHKKKYIWEAHSHKRAYKSHKFMHVYVRPFLIYHHILNLCIFVQRKIMNSIYVLLHLFTFSFVLSGFFSTFFGFFFFRSESYFLPHQLTSHI